MKGCIYNMKAMEIVFHESVDLQEKVAFRDGFSHIKSGEAIRCTVHW